MSGWRLASSLIILRDQVNAAFPGRSKLSDGTIGDAAHFAEGAASDHNPWYGPGIVTAIDLTNDPSVGFDTDPFTDELQRARDPRIKYVIANGFIMDSRPGFNPWQWVTYSGENRHYSHVHVSVLASSICDDTRPWVAPMLSIVQLPLPSPEGSPLPVFEIGSRLLRLSNPRMVGTDVVEYQRVMRAWYPNLDIPIDGVFGPNDYNATVYLQKNAKITVDGIVGPQTLGVLNMV